MANLLKPSHAAITPGALRPFDSEFVLSATKPALVAYTIELTVTAPLLSTQSVEVDLCADVMSPANTVQNAVLLSSSQNAGLSLLSLETTSRQTLLAYIEAGFTVNLKKTGAGTATMVESLEVIFDDTL